MSKRTVICDIEADGLLSTVTQIWCIVCKDYNTGEIFTWTPDTLHEFNEFVLTVDQWIGHNFIAYDAKVIKKLLGLKIKPSRITDTLLVSRLQSYSRQGGHSLAAWGHRLQYPKLEYKDFSEYSEEMLEYCINDVELTYKVACYLKLEGKGLGSEKASKIEHYSQYLLEEQSEYGFALDVRKAHQLFVMFHNKANELEREVLAEIKPKVKFIKQITPKYTKQGVLSKVGLRMYGDQYINIGGCFSLVEWQDFALKSPKQKVERLEPYWKPTVRTKGYRKLTQKLKDKEITKEQFKDKQKYMWQLCEENFNTISDEAPQSLKKLGDYAMYISRYKEVEGWLDALGNDNRVHGNVFSIGAITHRMAHNSPNMANIPGISSPFGKECRECYTVSNPDTHVLLGCDASGIQLRILAHYMNDKDYTKEVVEGDIHSKNLEAMGIDKGVYNEDTGKWSARDIAKTFIYAWLLGAGDEKVGLICGGDSAFGRGVKDQFLSALPSLAKLKLKAADAAKSGRLTGLDGRKIELKSAHFALSAYLQGAESCIMKYAMLLWHKRVQEKHLDARQVAVVHDEFQVEVRKEHADEVGTIIVEAIQDAGKYFKLNCPMDGEYKIGTNWYETH